MTSPSCPSFSYREIDKCVSPTRVWTGGRREEQGDCIMSLKIDRKRYLRNNEQLRNKLACTKYNATWFLEIKEQGIGEHQEDRRDWQMWAEMKRGLIRRLFPEIGSHSFPQVHVGTWLSHRVDSNTITVDSAIKQFKDPVCIQEPTYREYRRGSCHSRKTSFRECKVLWPFQPIDPVLWVNCSHACVTLLLFWCSFPLIP